MHLLGSSKKTALTSVDMGVENRECCWKDRVAITENGREVSQNFKNKTTTLHDPATPLFGIHPKEKQEVPAEDNLCALQHHSHEPSKRIPADEGIRGRRGGVLLAEHNEQINLGDVWLRKTKASTGS